MNTVMQFLLVSLVFAFFSSPYAYTAEDANLVAENPSVTTKPGSAPYHAPELNRDEIVLPESPANVTITQGGSITHYPEGIFLSLEISEPSPISTSELAEDNSLVLQSVLDRLNATGSLPIDEYQLRIKEGDIKKYTEDKRRTDQRMNSIASVELRQVLAGLEVVAGELSIESGADTLHTRHITATLVDPSLKQLQRSSWTPEGEALELAIELLWPYAANSDADWWVSAATNGELKGELQIHVIRHASYIDVKPIYLVQGIDHAALIDLYTREVRIQEIAVAHSTTQVRTIVCRLENGVSWNTCEANSQLPSSYPQVLPVFGEDGNGNRVCTAAPPFNLPTQSDCDLKGFKQAHEVIKRSENNLSNAFPNDCCENLGEGIQDIFGLEYQQVDVLMKTAEVNAPLFKVDGNPTRATIHIPYNMMIGQDNHGWQDLMGHEWAHSVQYYLAPSNGIGGVMFVSEVVGVSIREGLADVWMTILGDEEYGRGWDWVFRNPAGGIYRSIGGTENWSDYAHSIFSVHDNGEIFAALFKNMRDKSLAANDLKRIWFDITTKLNINSSPLSDTTQTAGQVNVYDFAQNLVLRVNQTNGSSNKKKICQSWEEFGLSIFNLPTQVCDPDPVTQSFAVFGGCSPGANPTAKWTWFWDNPDFLS